MSPHPSAVDTFLTSLPGGRREAITAVLQVLRKHMPKGYEETLSGGMITWQVPLETFPDTPDGKPLMYAALGSQKHHMALYLCALYADRHLREQLEGSYARAGMTLDCGVGCIRFHKLSHLHLPAIGKAAGACSVRAFIALTKKAAARNQG